MQQVIVGASANVAARNRLCRINAHSWKLSSPPSAQPAVTKATLLMIAASNPPVVTMTPSDAGQSKVMPTTLPIVHGSSPRNRLLELRPVTTP
jgi:hypothetical protein